MPLPATRNFSAIEKKINFSEVTERIFIRILNISINISLLNIYTWNIVHIRNGQLCYNINLRSKIMIMGFLKVPAYYNNWQEWLLSRFGRNAMESKKSTAFAAAITCKQHIQ